MSKSVPFMFSSRSFIVSGVTFRSLINFEFIFLYDEWKCCRHSFTYKCSVFDHFRLTKVFKTSKVNRYDDAIQIVFNLPHAMLSHFNRVRLCATQWTVACQAPLSMGFSKARILESVSIPSSRGSSQPRDGACGRMELLHLLHCRQSLYH